jgi:hypothetical protein
MNWIHTLALAIARLMTRIRLALTPTSVASELKRLNDSVESLMIAYNIPRYTREQLAAPPPSQITVTSSNEADDAYTEWLAEYHAARSRVVQHDQSDTDDLDNLADHAE